MTDISNGKDPRLALLRTEKWRHEIERAVDRIKESVNRSKSDRWFRKLWYIAEARRKKGYKVRRDQTRRRQIGAYGGDEDGRGKRRGGGSLCPAGRPAWGDAVLCGPALEAVQERAESARILGFRK